MKKRIVYVLGVVLLVIYGVYIFFISPILKEINAVRHLEFREINLAAVRDGAYRGKFGEGSFLYEVEVIVTGNKIVAINVLRNRNSRYAKNAEGVIAHVLAAQSLQVDVVSGATTTSKAFLKAIENALLSAN